MKKIHPIGAVVRKTGLSTHVLRAWERRYGAIIPKRSDGNQRLYSDEDIRRLVLLTTLVQDGARIGRIARLTEEELIRSISTADPIEPSVPADRPDSRTDHTQIEDALKHIESFDSGGLQKELSSWLAKNGIIPVIERLVPSLMEQIGVRWSDGRYRISHEHMASGIVRGLLSRALEDLGAPAAGSSVVTCTPPGESHDIGALLCALAARAEGFEALHLGADVPYSEIIHLSHMREVTAILLSITFSLRDARLVQDLRSLRNRVPPGTRIVIGGRATGGYGKRIDDTDIEILPSIRALRLRLAGIHSDGG